MAQFDVLRLADGALVIDCQTNSLSDIGTRFVVPLQAPDEAPPRQPRLNPIFEIDGEPMIMVTQFAGAVPTSELRGRVATLALDYLRVTNAIDMLIGGI